MTGSLAANRQTFAHQTNQFTPVLTHPFFLILPSTTYPFAFSLSYSLHISLTFSLETTSTSTDTRTIGPGAQACSKKLVIQCTRFSSSLFYFFFSLLRLFLVPTSLFSSAAHRTLSRLSSLIATLSTLFPPERDRSARTKGRYRQTAPAIESLKVGLLVTLYIDSSSLQRVSWDREDGVCVFENATIGLLD